MLGSSWRRRGLPGSKPAPEDKRRNEGSTIAASILGVLLFLAGAAWAIGWPLHYRLSWELAEPFIDVGAFWLFGGVLLWWAFSAGEHKPESEGRIGSESIAMIVGVLSALVAVLTLVDAAAHHTPDPKEQKSSCPVAEKTASAHGAR